MAVRGGDHAKLLGGVHEREQVVHLVGEEVGEVCQVDAVAVVIRHVDEAGEVARGCRRQDVAQRHGRVRRCGRRRLRRRRRGTRDSARSRGGIRTRRRGLAGERGVELVHDGLELGRVLVVARTRQVDDALVDDVAGMRAKHDHAVGHLHGLLDVVRHDEDGAHGALGRTLPVLVAREQVNDLAAEVLGRQHVKRREGLVHEEHVGLEHERSRDAHALAHAAAELLGVGVLEAVEADNVDGVERRLGALLAGDAASLEAQLHVLLHRKPREQRKRLEHEAHAGIGAGELLAAVLHGARGGRHETRQHAKEGGLAGTRTAEQRHDLAIVQLEAHVAQDRELLALLTLIGLLHVIGTQQYLVVVLDRHGHDLLASEV